MTLTFRRYQSLVMAGQLPLTRITFSSYQSSNTTCRLKVRSSI